MYTGGKMLFSRVGSADTAYVYIGDKLLLRKEGLTAARYYHHDVSPQNVRMTTVYSGTLLVEAKCRYKPFGDIIVLYGSAGRFQYAQQEYDSSERLYHMGLRYQDPVVGRWIERDPLGDGYEYALNDPVTFTDLTGAIVPLVALAIIFLVVGTAGVGVASHYVPEIRPYTDPIADVVSFVPLYGDAFALGYYGSQGGLDCAAGSCDPLTVGLNLGGSVPILGDLGKAVKLGGAGIGLPLAEARSMPATPSPGGPLPVR